MDKKEQLIDATDLIERLRKLADQIEVIKKDVEEKRLKLLALINERDKWAHKELEKLDGRISDISKELKFLRREFLEWKYK